MKKAEDVAEKLEGMKLKRAAGFVRESVEQTLTYMSFPREHWTRLRTNNPLERLMREIKRRTKVVGAFPDGNSADAAIRTQKTSARHGLSLEMSHVTRC